MNIQNGATRKLHERLAVPTAWRASGAIAGSRATIWMTFPALERRSVFPPAVRAEATALACSLPKEKGKPFSRWSLSEIAACLVALELVTHIAVSTIGRWFRAEKLKPWRYHNWQHILNPQAFLERARPVLRLYEQAGELLRQGI